MDTDRYHNLIKDKYTFPKFQSSDNHIIFEESRNWCEDLKNIYSQYGSQIHNVYDLKKFLWEHFLR